MQSQATCDDELKGINQNTGVMDPRKQTNNTATCTIQAKYWMVHIHFTQVRMIWEIIIFSLL